MDEFERTIQELEAIFTDPELERILSNAREINKLISEETATTEDAIQIVEDLNVEWRLKEFHAKKMYVTGPVYVGGQFHTIEDIAPMDDTRNEMVNTPFTSQGFSMLNVVSEVDGALQYDQQLVMWGYMEVKGKGGVGGVTIEKCGIYLTDEVSIECREMTPAKVSAWLEAYHPDVKQSIDATVVSSENEADATLNLAEVPLIIDTMNKKELKDLKLFTEVYLNQVIQYEQHVPYIVELAGHCEVFYANGGGFTDNVIATDRKRLMLVSELSIRTNETKTEFIVWIHGIVMEKDKKSTKLLRMPIETVHTIESGRDILRAFF